jgi:hypothetical protein
VPGAGTHHAGRPERDARDHPRGGGHCHKPGASVNPARAPPLHLHALTMFCGPLPTCFGLCMSPFLVFVLHVFDYDLSLGRLSESIAWESALLLSWLRWRLVAKI